MSSEDFASNNDDPTNPTAGRGARSRVSTPGIAQHNAAEAKKAESRARRRQTQHPTTATLTPSAAAGSSSLAAAVPTIQHAPQSFAPMHPTPPMYQYRQNQPYNVPQLPTSSPSPFYPPQNTTPDMSNPSEWDRGLNNRQLFTMPDATHLEGYHQFNPEEEDEMFDDPDANLPDPSALLPSTNTPQMSAIVQSTLPASVPSAVSGPANTQFTTPQNLRVFPQDTPSCQMSSISVEGAPRRLVRRARSSTSSPASTMESPAASSSLTRARAPLVHRVNVFGPGLHDHRQRPRQLSQAVVTAEKENTVHHLPPDEDDHDAPPKKKSRKEPAARSIKNLDPRRRAVVEAGYAYVRLMVLTDSTKTWLNDGEGLAHFAQDAFDYGVRKLKLDPSHFAPVEPLEQDLNRERIYGARGDFKEIAREVVKGPDGYGFRCGSGHRPTRRGY
ncbi:hypothetical protein B0H11DRAFT_1914764 [Mycena galericulata]|nr:hypothetical protein B0H11DRAFT_1914764 [Mycena galericulata]